MGAVLKRFRSTSVNSFCFRPAFGTESKGECSSGSVSPLVGLAGRSTPVRTPLANTRRCLPTVLLTVTPLCLPTQPKVGHLIVAQ